MIDDAEILKRLEMMSTTGALNRYLWENPERWVEMHKWILEDSEQNPDAGIGNVSAMFGGLTIGGAKEQRRVYGRWNLSHIEEQYRLAVVGLLHHAWVGCEAHAGFDQLSPKRWLLRRPKTALDGCL